MKKGLIHIYCGDGKGKTTCAIGLSVRAAGSGMKVLVARFLKTEKSGELNSLAQIDNIDVLPSEKNFGWSFQMTDQEKENARKTCSELLTSAFKTAISGGYDLLVLDEIIATNNLNFVNENVLLDYLKGKPANLEVVMTGREPTENLLKVADYVSVINKEKHPYDKGVNARKGIEF